MAKCPKCGREIDHVVTTVVEAYRYNIRLPKLDDKGSLDIDEETGLLWEDESDWGDNVKDGPFCCPVCEAEISDDVQVIVSLLKDV